MGRRSRARRWRFVNADPAAMALQPEKALLGATADRTPRHWPRRVRGDVDHVLAARTVRLAAVSTP